MIYFGIGVAVGAAAAALVYHFAVVRRLLAEIERYEAQVFEAGADTLHKL